MAEHDVLRRLKKQWLTKIRYAIDHKNENFQKFADEAMDFFRGPYQFMGSLRQNASGYWVASVPKGDDFPNPSIMMSVNRTAELVQLFAPYLYFKNPARTVNPRKTPMIEPEAMGDPNDPMVQQMWQQIGMQVQQGRSTDVARASLVQHYLNYTPYALNLKQACRDMIDEALIKGMGVLWTEVYQPAGSNFKMVGSFFDSVDNLQIDPDAEILQDAYWVARRRVEPVWKVEKKFGWRPGSMKGNMESVDRQSIVEANMEWGEGDIDRRRGLTNDSLIYYEIYSKMGLGGRLKNSYEKDSAESQETMELDTLGDNVYLAVADSVEYPLNLRPESMGDYQSVWRAVQWQTPFWADDGWPFKELSFHKIPRQVWPMSHMRPAAGELHFLNWAYSFVASKIKNSSRDIIALLESAGADIKAAIQDGKDYSIVNIKGSTGQSIKDIVQFLQYPQFNGDIWNVIQAIETNFEKRTGLSEIIYGATSRAERSATASQISNDRASIRPDDMANKVEDAMTDVARAEALAARWHLQPQDLVPVMGQVGAYFWQQFVAPADPSDLLHQLEYRIEAGSIRKPNKEKEIEDANNAVQFLSTPLFQVAGMGQVGPFNALLTMWGKANNVEVEPFLIQPPPPPPEPQGPSPEEMAAQEQAQEMEQKGQSHQQEMVMKVQRHMLDMQIAKDKAEAAKKAAAKNGEKK